LGFIAKGKKEKMSLILLTLIELENSNTHATMNLEDKTIQRSNFIEASNIQRLNFMEDFKHARLKFEDLD
jgi:hypothetical protein